jgi:hypothetical protein
LRAVKLLVAKAIIGQAGLLIRLRLNGLNSPLADLHGDAPTADAGDTPAPHAGGTPGAPAEVGKDGQTVNVRGPNISVMDPLRGLRNSYNGPFRVTNS